ALLTPLDRDGNVKTELAQELIDLYVRQKAAGVYMLGWTGEGAHLSVEKRKTWAEAVLAVAKGRIPVFVHVGYNENLDDSVELAAHAAAHGADAVSSVGISTKATLDDNIQYFKRISEAAPNIPFYIYWVMQGTTLTGGRPLQPTEILEAMKAVPTFAGIKFTDTNFYTLERFKKHAPELNILTGADELAFCSQLMGADGNIGALQAVTLYHYQEMFRLVNEGKIKEARELQYRANEVSEAYADKKIGNLPGIKLLMERIYGIPVGYCSPDGPFKDAVIAEEDADRLVEIFRKNILLPD
ncbi:MAG: dihydrodipicolinate synthase family protein, partial [Lachnospiraceae bacterium]|nr:dihydrodipicolinate synthase family protein [Lachnospiraceae bacterium]